MTEEIEKTIRPTSHWKDSFLVIQGFFYFVQGGAMVAIMMISVYLMNKYGLSDEQAISYQSIYMFPWYIKILFGLTTDKFSIKNFGRRRPYILIAGILGIFGWFGFASLDTFGPLVIVCALLLAGSVAIADTVFDSLGVDITPANRRSAMQGVGWGMRGLGGFISGTLFGNIADNIGYSAGYYIFGTLMIVGCFITLFISEPKDENGKIIVSDISFKDVKDEFKKPETLLCTVYNLLGGATLAVVSVLSVFLNDSLGISIEDVGLAYSIFAAGQFVGAITAGLIGGKFDLKKITVGICAAYVILIGSFLLDPFKTINSALVMVGILGAVSGSYEATQMRIGMELSVGKLSGTMYSWFTSISNIGQLAIGALAISAVAQATGSYLIAMQLSSIFMILGLIPGFKVIKKWKKSLNKSGE